MWLLSAKDQEPSSNTAKFYIYSQQFSRNEFYKATIPKLQNGRYTAFELVLNNEISSLWQQLNYAPEQQGNNKQLHWVN